MKKWTKGIIYTLACIVAYIVVVAITIAITGGSILDTDIWRGHLFYIIGIVAVAAIFKMHIFTTIFLTGSAIGFVWDAMISFQNRNNPSMEGGMKNMMITLIGCVIAVIAQVLVINAKEKIKAQASKKKIKALEAENKKVVDKVQALEKNNIPVEEDIIVDSPLKVMEITQPEIETEEIEEIEGDAGDIDTEI